MEGIPSLLIRHPKLFRFFFNDNFLWGALSYYSEAMTHGAPLLSTVAPLSYLSD